MAKIRTTVIRITHKDIEKLFKVNLLYNTSMRFHIEVPEEFRNTVNLNYRKLNIEKTEKSFFIVAETEDECFSKF